MLENILSRLAGGRGSWVAYRRLLGYTRPYLRRLILGAAFGLVFAGSSIGALAALRGLINYEKLSSTQVVMFACLLPLVTAIRAIGAYFGEYLVQWVGHRTVMDLRVRIFGHLLQLPISYIEGNRSSDAISRTVSDVTLVQHSVSNQLVDLVKQPFVLVFTAGYMIHLNWQLAILSFVVFPLFVLPAIILGRRVRRAAREGQERLADIVEIMQETLGGARIVKAFQMEEREAARFREQCSRFFGRIMRVVRAQAMMTPIVECTAIVMLVAAFFHAFRTAMPFQDFIVFSAGLALLYDPCKRLGRMHIYIQQSSAAAERIFELLDAEISVAERPDADNFTDTLESIQFDNVTFAYDAVPVLSGIDFSVKAGERIAVVGMSGAGKTTLVSLLLRFFDATDGSIRFNGRDVRELTLESVRRQHGVVTQDTILFNDTVANNIAYGDPAADRDRIREAARRAHADEFIVEMEEGYDTMVGERGMRLSGGQRQRLAIARAILLDPPVLVLDEATSALDSESERLVQEALAEVMQGRTVFAIAHRLSTIINCDRVLVLDQGRLAEHGTHQELLLAGGIYKRLYDLQFNT